MTARSDDDPQRTGGDPAFEKPGPSGRALRPSMDFGPVLVVDDDPDAVEILTRLLDMQKFSTVPARSGPQCLEIVRSQPIDVARSHGALPRQCCSVSVTR